jgi:hypothetical protein
MQLVNESSRTEPAIRHLVEFVSAYIGASSKVILSLSDHCKVGKMTQGFTARLAKNRPILVSMGLSQRMTYPHTSRHVPCLPPVRLTSFHEEFVLVLAHELRHADQIDQGAFLKEQVYEAEVDAEGFAISVLDAYRRHMAQAA